MRTQRCKGTKDLSPEEMRRFRLIEGIFRESCFKWGYEEIRTPTLEYLHLFTSTGTLAPSRLHKVYSFLDWDGWSGERVVLRPDGTIPVARLYIDTMADKKLAKLFYVTNLFIFEETGKEARERWQCGAELIGAGSIQSDVELVVMGLDILKKLGLRTVELRLSHAGLIRALLAKFGLSPIEQNNIFDQILNGDIEVLVRAKPDKPELGRALTSLLGLKGKASGFLKNMRSLFHQDIPELEPPLNNFIDVVDLLEARNIKYRIDITSGREFEYYTGFMFQFLNGNEHIGGGGRYDALIPLMGGQDIPASGFALYLDRLMKLIKPDTLTKPASLRVLVKPATEGIITLKEAFILIDYLHESGYAAEVYLGGEQSTDFRWILDIREKAPLFVLTDQVNNNKSKLKTTDEVLSALKMQKR
ncbi:MAG: ATP phosphoribosyltransferase regulatory subunit [Dehalococcoidales bacterium]|nr:ATP phosphoribosyltransferase regulatory subunit [Dehalococcoidales bacterium]